MKNNILDPTNDIVLTPDYIADFMCKLANVSAHSVVGDVTAGDGSLLLAAYKNGAQALTGVEYADFMYSRLLDNLKSNGVNLDEHTLIHGDGLAVPCDLTQINTLLLNPPYSAEGKGFVFANYVMQQMQTGTAVILTMENAGRGCGLPHTKEILKHSTLKAVIKLSNIFKGYAEVDVALYVFDCSKQHELTDKVFFLDMSYDGYTRSGRKNQRGNAKDDGTAKQRYEEVLNRFRGKEPGTTYYEDLCFYDTINLDGEDWSYAQHKKIDLTPTEDDFKKTVADYMEFKCKQALMRNGFDIDHPYTLAAVKMGVS